MNKEIKNLSLTYNAKIEPIEKLNEQFVKCKCYVHAIGKNANLSHFSKDNVLRNIDSINYIPVVGHLYEGKDGNMHMGGHDMAITVDDKGLQIKPLTVPYGVVMKDTWAFEDIVEDDGTTATYIVADVILWVARYPELATAIYSEDIYFAESMEINYTAWQPLKEDKNYADIIDWVYSALCLLGKSDNSEYNVIPCFPSSKIEPYSINFNQTEFSKVMGELKDQLSFYFNKDNGMKGGAKTLNKEIRATILQEFKLTLEDIDFEITDEMTEEEFKLKLEEFTKIKESSIHSEAPVLFSATYRQKREALNNALEGEVIYDANGNLISETSYWVEDFDDTNVFVEKDVWTVDDYNCNYGRFTYTFDATTLQATITGEFEEMVKVWLTIEENQALQTERASYELLNTEFSDYKEKYSTLNTEVERLKQFETKVKEEQRKTDEDELFNQFESQLSSMEEFAKLKENAKDFTIEDLSEKLFALLGKKNANFSVKPKSNTIKIPLDGGSENGIKENDPYGGLHAKYGKQPITKKN